MTASTFTRKNQGGRSQELHFTEEMTEAGVGMITQTYAYHLVEHLGANCELELTPAMAVGIHGLGVTDLTFTRPF